MNKQFQLVVAQGPYLGEVFPLDSSIVVIGRDPLVDITLPDPEVSRQHARMARDEYGDYKIQDLGSTNGTFVDGQRLGGDPLLLHAGQEILLGSTVLLRYELVNTPADLVEDFALEDVVRETAVAPLLTAAEPGEELAAADSSDDALNEPLPELLQADSAAPAEEPALPLPASPVFKAPPPSQGAPYRAPAEPLVPTGPSEQNKKRHRTITWVIVTVALLILCCCAFFLTAWYWWGDPLMEALGVY